MGAVKSKLPDRTNWIKKLKLYFQKSYSEKEFFYIIWLVDNQPVWHSNINVPAYGESATMHLHLWKSNSRKKELGLDFLKLTLSYYFENFKLKKLICEPYSKNIAPNKLLTKLGFELIRSYDTIPDQINFYQTVNRYGLTMSQWKHIQKNDFY